MSTDPRAAPFAGPDRSPAVASCLRSHEARRQNAVAGGLTLKMAFTQKLLSFVFDMANVGEAAHYYPTFGCQCQFNVVLVLSAPGTLRR